MDERRSKEAGPLSAVRDPAQDLGTAKGHQGKNK